jgi:hypothetical protein
MYVLQYHFVMIELLFGERESKPKTKTTSTVHHHSKEFLDVDFFKFLPNSALPSPARNPGSLAGSGSPLHEAQFSTQ